MKKILTLATVVLFSISTFAQTVWKDTVEYKSMLKNDIGYRLHDTIYNNTTDTITVTWSKTNQSILTGWSGVAVCENLAGGGSCYSWSLLTGFKSFDILPNSSATLDVELKAAPTAVDGTSWVELTVSNIGPLVFKFSTAGSSSTRNFENNNIVNVYPNPASNYVNIALNDHKISSINVVNVIGRRIAKFNVDPAKNDLIHVPLDKVSDGIYLLQFADLNGKVLGVRRVTKQ